MELMLTVEAAASNGFTEVVDVLLDKKADINLESSEGESPVSLAISSDSLQTALTLIRRGRHL